MGLFKRSGSSDIYDDDTPNTKLLENVSKLLGGSSRSYDETVSDEKASDREIVVSFVKDYLKALTHRD